MVGRLMSDIFMQGCSIPPKTSIKVVLHPAPASFVLMAAADSEYEMHIEHAQLNIVRQVTPMPLVQAVENLREKRNIKLNYRRTEVTMLNIKGRQKESVSLFSDSAPLPDRIVVGFVTSKAYAGQIESNPYNFQKLDYTSLQLTVDGVKYPNEPYRPDFGNSDDYHSIYNSLLHEFNADTSNHMINVTPAEFLSGYTLYPFRLTPRACCGDVLGDPLSGPVNLDLVKKTEASDTLTLIVLAEYRSEYEIAEVGGVSSEPRPQQ
jgi:hypothetical protein